MLNPNNFIIKINEKMAFKECWLDRCIDRGDEYIPFYPYWKEGFYTPQEWVDEGLDLIQYEYHPKTVKEVINKAKDFGLKVVSSHFDTDISFAPSNEGGDKIYPIPEFLDYKHKENEYEGYVFYGRTIVVFDTSDYENFYKFVSAYLNRH